MFLGLCYKPTANSICSTARGSSGAWVTLENQLCGHIVAIRQDVPWAYMTAIEPILKDIRRELATDDVRLPQAIDLELCSTLFTQPVEPQPIKSEIPGEIEKERDASSLQGYQSSRSTQSYKQVPQSASVSKVSDISINEQGHVIHEQEHMTDEQEHTISEQEHIPLRQGMDSSNETPVLPHIAPQVSATDKKQSLLSSPRLGGSWLTRRFGSVYIKKPKHPEDAETPKEYEFAMPKNSWIIWYYVLFSVIHLANNFLLPLLWILGRLLFLLGSFVCLPLSLLFLLFRFRQRQRLKKRDFPVQVRGDLEGQFHESFPMVEHTAARFDAEDVKKA